MNDRHHREESEQPWSIEVAGPEDAESLLDVNVRSWLATYPNEAHGITREDVAATISADLPERVKTWEGFLERARESVRAHIWTAKSSDGTVVGFCLARRHDDANVVQMLYLLPEWQGHGIGSRLLENAFSWFDQHNPVRLSVVSYNTKAITFYRRHGFEPRGDLPASKAIPLASGKLLPEIRMEKRF